MNTLRWVLCGWALCVLATLGARAEAPALQGTTLDGRPFSLPERSGRVVMVVLWRTDCPVCMNKMQELRENAAGWRGKPFDLVLLNLDRTRTDAASHDQTRRLVDSSKAPLWSLWHGDAQVPSAWAQPARLPVLMIFDGQGVLAKRHEGRVPAEAWDDVAELLP